MLANLTHPMRLVPIAFMAAIAIGTALLMLPLSHQGPGHAPFLTALFTATSAVCVTGLAVVDTPVYWSSFGQVVILALFQVGGFGIMAAATLLGLLVGRGFRLKDRLRTQVERSFFEMVDARSVLRLILWVTITVEAALTLALTLRLHFFYDQDWAVAAWHGFFHAVSAFNNAGFSTYSDSLMGFQDDWLFLMPIMVVIVFSSLGFPVIHELQTRATAGSARPWTLHTKITLLGSAILLLVGFATVLAVEWGNPDTLGPMGLGGKLLNSAFQSVTTRTTGFNALDIGALNDETLAVTYLLMFIGGGSAGTAGGVKVGTVAVLVLLVIAEVRGHSDTEAFGRRVGASAQRQAITVLALGSVLVVLGTLALQRLSHFPTDQIIFEVISAFGTVGLSTGITAQLPLAGQMVLALLMFFGRVGTITLATSLVLGERRMPYRYPEEHPIVG